jgi:hypothetical protein
VENYIVCNIINGSLFQEEIFCLKKNEAIQAIRRRYGDIRGMGYGGGRYNGLRQSFVHLQFLASLEVSIHRLNIFVHRVFMVSIEMTITHQNHVSIQERKVNLLQEEKTFLGTTIA